MKSVMTRNHFISDVRIGTDNGRIHNIYQHDAVYGLLHQFIIHHLEGFEQSYQLKKYSEIEFC